MKVFRPQSYKHTSYGLDGIELPSGHGESVTIKGYVLKDRDGNLVTIEVYEDDSMPIISFMSVTYSGVVEPEQGNPVVALANGSAWSGGRNYTGFLVGRLGDRVCFSRKGDRTRYEVTENGWEELPPMPSGNAVIY